MNSMFHPSRVQLSTLANTKSLLNCKFCDFKIIPSTDELSFEFDQFLAK